MNLYEKLTKTITNRPAIHFIIARFEKEASKIDLEKTRLENEYALIDRTLEPLTELAGLPQNELLHVLDTVAYQNHLSFVQMVQIAYSFEAYKLLKKKEAQQDAHE